MELSKYSKEDAYFFKIGALPLNLFNEDLSKLSDKEFIVTLENTFDNYPNLLGWKKIKDDLSEDIVTSENYKKKISYKTFFNFLYYLKLQIPEERMRKEFFAVLKQDKFLDMNRNLNVFYDGFSYLYFKKVDLSKPFFIGGVSGREELTDLFKTQKYPLVHCAPNPFREEFLLIFTNKDLPQGISYSEFNEIGSRIVCFLPKQKGLSAEIYLENFFRENNFCLEQFYNAKSTKGLLKNGKWKMHELLSSAFQRIVNSKKMNLSKIENVCSKIYLHLNRFFENRDDFKKEKSRFLENIKDKHFFILIFSILEHELKEETLDIMEMGDQLRYLTNVIENKKKFKQWFINIGVSIATSLITLIIGLNFFN